MKKTSTLLVCASFLFACGGSDADGSHGQEQASDDGDEHAEEEGHDDSEEGDHAHDEDSLGTVTVGELSVELAQGHGAVEAGKEGHLVVKLPYNDGGSTTVRAWIGTADRTLSLVSKGGYAPSHDDYDIHALAPDPLPEDALWWFELEQPDGTRVVGSVEPIR